MTPLRVTAHLQGGVVFHAPLMLDAILAAVVANRNGLLAPAHPDHCERLDIPIAREPAGRFHLCSEALFVEAEAEARYKQRRAPVMEFARLGNDKIRRVDIAAGANKGYRVPYVVRLLEQGRLTWYCLGDAAAIADLLGDVRYVGRFRGSGKGKLAAPWLVEQCERWEGFPVVRGGKPIRPLPLDWPGLREPRTGYRTLTYPSYNHSEERLVAIP